MKRVTERGS